MDQIEVGPDDLVWWFWCGDEGNATIWGVAQEREEFDQELERSRCEHGHIVFPSSARGIAEKFNLAGNSVYMTTENTLTTFRSGSPFLHVKVRHYKGRGHPEAPPPVDISVAKHIKNNLLVEPKPSRPTVNRNGLMYPPMFMEEFEGLIKLGLPPVTRVTPETA